MTLQASRLFLLLFLLAAFSAAAFARPPVFNKDASPLVIQASLLHSDNQLPITLPDVSANGLVLMASGDLVLTREGYGIKLSYQGQGQRYAYGDGPQGLQRQFNQGRMGMLLRGYLTKRWTVDLDMRYAKVQELLGEGLSRSRIGVTQGDRYTEKMAGANLIYGANPQDRFIAMAVQQKKREYQRVNSYSKDFDLDQKELKAEAGYRISDQTQLIANALVQKDSYPSATRADSTLKSVQVGAHWQATGKTELEVLVGGYQRKNEGDGQGDLSGTSWQIKGTYQPKEHWQLTLSSSRSSQPGDNLLAADTQLTQWLVNGMYRFSERWRAGVFVEDKSTLYRFVDGELNRDESDVGIEASLYFQDYHGLMLRLSRNALDDEQSQLDYRQNKVSLMWFYEF